MISGDNKGVNNRQSHAHFGSITSLGKGCNGHCTLWLPIGNKWWKNYKYCVRHLNERFRNIFSGSTSATGDLLLLATLKSEKHRA